ncbi:MAG: long-chain-fatty-acid--CoA ligase [Pigmentiphaga sp.]|nr:long-chain-fatty-acid--CoA ligase [Pigmentiphaga sp.]
MQAEPPRHPCWPPGVPERIAVPDQTLWQGLAARAQADPDGTGLVFLGRLYSWAQLAGEAERLAGALQGLGIEPGARVVLFMQNCPQYVIGFHAILRAGAVAVPLNPMNKAVELTQYLADADATVVIASSDIAAEVAAAAAGQPSQSSLRHLVVFDLADGLPNDIGAASSQWPDSWRPWLLGRDPRPVSTVLSVHDWDSLVARAPVPRAVPAAGADLAAMPYTSGTTGTPKGCMHSHATMLHNALTAGPWLGQREGDTVLIAVPMFHVTGLVMGMLAAIQWGCRMVVLPRWDARQAARAIEQYEVTHWPNIPTMVIDLLANPDAAGHSLQSLRYIGGGGAPMPAAVAEELRRRTGLSYVEGYGLTETAAPSHTNPRQAVRLGSMGIPYIGVEALVIDLDTLQPLASGEVGEIVVRGPQVFLGYWRQPRATAEAFVDIAGRRFFRTGDLGRVDADGYFHLADRLKRMINASGFKVWPAEVEGILHRHPAVQQACVIASRHPYRGETVKAVVVLQPAYRDRMTPEELVDWARQEMSAYKYPRTIEFADSLPRSATGKVLWRQLQRRQDELDAQQNPGET